MARNIGIEERLFILTVREFTVLDEFNRGKSFTAKDLALHLEWLKTLFPDKEVKAGNIQRILTILVDHKLLDYQLINGINNRVVKEYFITNRGMKYVQTYFRYERSLSLLFPNRLEVIA